MKQTPAPEPRWVTWSLAAAILAVAAVLRFREAMRAPLWFDEIMTLWVTRLPVGDMLATVARDIHPPLHFLLVKGWRALGGEGDLWIKSLSIVFGLALIVLMIPIGRTLFGRAAGWLGASLLAVHWAHVYVSQETRFYGLMWLWLAGAAWMAWRWCERGRLRDGLGFVLCAAAGLYTHYLSGVVLGFLGLWGVVALRKRPASLVVWLALHAAIFVLFVPQLSTFLRQLAQSTASHWIQPPAWRSLFDLARKVSFGAVYLIPPVAALTVLPLARPDQRRAASMLWTLVLGPTLLCFGLTRAGMHVYTERYMLYCVPLVCLLVAAGIVALPGRAVRAVVASLLLVAALRIVIVRPPFVESAQQAIAAEWMSRHVAPTDTVYHADIHSLLFFRHYRPNAGRHLLLWWSSQVQYYDGAAMIHDAWRVDGSAFDSLSASGRWWGVCTVQGGVDPTPSVRRFDELGEYAGPKQERVSIWRGRGIVLGE